MIKKDVMLNGIADVKEFVNIMSKLPVSADISCDRYIVDAKSIMGIFSLDLSRPVRLVIHDAGKDISDELKDLEKFTVD